MRHLPANSLSTDGWQARNGVRPLQSNFYTEFCNPPPRAIQSQMEDFSK